ncbi:uncharacterized protein [Ptychodera flava]|uniref:uncharacterized protein n=1 Tax=Ptychodera flava TaxID=63121 RepID=UPI00396A989D
MESFLGLANYHRSFIKNFANLAAPLYMITGKQAFRWEEEQQAAFESIKAALLSPPVLAMPDQTGKFVLDTDASDYALGAELSQVQDGEEKVIAYASISLTTGQCKYCTIR